jgi:hypothetical protein
MTVYPDCPIELQFALELCIFAYVGGDVLYCFHAYAPLYYLEVIDLISPNDAVHPFGSRFLFDEPFLKSTNRARPQDRDFQAWISQKFHRLINGLTGKRSMRKEGQCVH